MHRSWFLTPNLRKWPSIHCWRGILQFLLYSYYNLEMFFTVLNSSRNCFHVCLFIVLLDGSLHPSCPLGKQNSFRPEVVTVFTYSPLFMCILFILARSCSYIFQTHSQQLRCKLWVSCFICILRKKTSVQMLIGSQYLVLSIFSDLDKLRVVWTRSLTDSSHYWTLSSFSLPSSPSRSRWWRGCCSPPHHCHFLIM